MEELGDEKSSLKSIIVSPSQYEGMARFGSSCPACAVQ